MSLSIYLYNCELHPKTGVVIKLSEAIEATETAKEFKACFEQLTLKNGIHNISYLWLWEVKSKLIELLDREVKDGVMSAATKDMVRGMCTTNAMLQAVTIEELL